MSTRKKSWPTILTEAVTHTAKLAVASVHDPGAAMMFYRREDGFVLQVALEYSRRYSERFTASFYLARSFSWPLAGGDSPSIAYRRIGALLPPDELVNYGIEDPKAEVWWHGFNGEQAGLFAQAIDRAQQIFLTQSGLREKVMNSHVLNEHFEQVMLTRKLALANEGCEPPAKIRMNKLVSSAWYRAATAALVQTAPSAANKDGIKFTAEDAWCLEYLL